MGLGARNAELARSSARVVSDWMASFKNPAAFQNDWVWLRLDVDLQTRLFVEQVLWDKGGVWRSMVTGFGPGKRVGIGLPGKKRSWTAGQHAERALRQRSRRLAGKPEPRRWKRRISKRPSRQRKYSNYK